MQPLDNNHHIHTLMCSGMSKEEAQKAIDSYHKYMPVSLDQYVNIVASAYSNVTQADSMRK